MLVLWGIGTLVFCRQDVYDYFSEIRLDYLEELYNVNPDNPSSSVNLKYLIRQICQLFILGMILLAYLKNYLFMYPFVIYLIGYIVELSQFIHLKHSLKYNSRKLIYSLFLERNIPNLVEDVSKGIAYVTMGIIIIF